MTDLLEAAQPSTPPSPVPEEAAPQPPPPDIVPPSSQSTPMPNVNGATPEPVPISPSPVPEEPPMEVPNVPPSTAPPVAAPTPWTTSPSLSPVADTPAPVASPPDLTVPAISTTVPPPADSTTSEHIAVGMTAPPTDTPPKNAPPLKKKGSRVGIIVTALLLLFFTVPLTVYYVSQQKELADIRNRASGTDPCQSAGYSCMPYELSCASPINRTCYVSGTRCCNTKSSTPPKPTATPTPKPCGQEGQFPTSNRCCGNLIISDGRCRNATPLSTPTPLPPTCPYTCMLPQACGVVGHEQPGAGTCSKDSQGQSRVCCQIASNTPKPPPPTPIPTKPPAPPGVITTTTTTAPPGGGTWDQCRLDADRKLPCGSCNVNSVGAGTMSYGCELDCGGSVTGCPDKKATSYSIAHRWERCLHKGKDACSRQAATDYVESGDLSPFSPSSIVGQSSFNNGSGSFAEALKNNPCGRYQVDVQMSAQGTSVAGDVYNTGIDCPEPTTPPTASAPSCESLRIYAANGADITDAVRNTTRKLSIGETVTLATTKGVATKAHFRIQGITTFAENDVTLNTANEYRVEITIPTTMTQAAGQFEAEVFINGQWK